MPDVLCVECKSVAPYKFNYSFHIFVVVLHAAWMNIKTLMKSANDSRNIINNLYIFIIANVSNKNSDLYVFICIPRIYNKNFKYSIYKSIIDTILVIRAETK